MFRNVGRKSDFILIRPGTEKVLRKNKWSTILLRGGERKIRWRKIRIYQCICKLDIMSNWPKLFGWSGVKTSLIEVGWGERMRGEEMENLENKPVLWWAFLNGRTRKWVEINQITMMIIFLAKIILNIKWLSGCRKVL